MAEFPAKDYQARILLAWHPLVETAGQGYDLTKVDSHASAGDVVAFIEDEDIPVYVRLAVFDVYWRSTTGIFKVAFLISKVPVGGYIDILFLLS